MFDPTIYDNLKVVLEGNLYELDFAEEIKIVNREDIVDLASMSREFSMQFQTANSISDYPFGEIKLATSVEDFTIEMIDGDEKRAGCEIHIHFYTKIRDVERDCPNIQKNVAALWNGRPKISQQITFSYGSEGTYENNVKLSFNRKINEDQIDDLPNIINYAIETLQYFDKRFGKIV